MGSEWNSNHFTNLSYIFYNCKSLKDLSGISNWNTNNVSDISFMTYNCFSLKNYPDLSNWDISNAIINNIPDIKELEKLTM